MSISSKIILGDEILFAVKTKRAKAIRLISPPEAVCLISSGARPRLAENLKITSSFPWLVAWSRDLCSIVKTASGIDNVFSISCILLANAGITSSRF